jgi:transcriptional regulator with XRE-family HTH domain
MNERLTTFLRAEQLSPAQFADLMGIQRSGVSHILSGRNNPGFDFFLTFLRKFPAANIEWLISGRGKMYKDMEMQPLFPDQSPLPEPKQTVTYGGEQDPHEHFIEEENPALPATSGKTPAARHIEKVVILYSDGTFSDFVKP